MSAHQRPSWNVGWDSPSKLRINPIGLLAFLTSIPTHRSITVTSKQRSPPLLEKFALHTQLANVRFNANHAGKLHRGAGHLLLRVTQPTQVGSVPKSARVDFHTKSNFGSRAASVNHQVHPLRLKRRIDFRRCRTTDPFSRWEWICLRALVNSNCLNRR